MGEKEYDFKIKEVIEKMVVNEGISLQAFANKHNIPYESLKNIVYKDCKDPRASTVMQISDALGLTPYQLLGYESTKVEALLSNYFKCGERGKDLVEYVAEEQALKNKLDENKKTHEVPCVLPVSHLEDGIVIYTGEVKYVQVAEEKAFAGYYINTDNFINEHFYRGDIILVEKRYPSIGEKCVVSNSNIAYFRIFEESDKEGYHFKLKAMNPNGQDFYVDDLKSPFMCVGTYIDAIRK